MGQRPARGGTIGGQLSTLFSRRPGAAPLTIFFFEGHDVDGRSLDRRGDVIRGNRQAAAAETATDDRRS